MLIPSSKEFSRWFGYIKTCRGLCSKRALPTVRTWSCTRPVPYTEAVSWPRLMQYEQRCLPVHIYIRGVMLLNRFLPHLAPSCVAEGSHNKYILFVRRMRHGTWRVVLEGVFLAPSYLPCRASKHGSSLRPIPGKPVSVLNYAPRHEEVQSSGGIDPHVLDLDTRWR
jgi:hypothetical protein